MTEIITFVFLDLETTGLPQLEGNKTKITEISLIEVKRDQIINTKSGELPRVVHKLTRIVNPKRLISFESTNITGLGNEFLEHETDFKAVFNTIDSFLNLCAKPVCFIAHNGDRFDYPILQAELKNIKQKLSDDILCIDSLTAFRALDFQTQKGSGDVKISDIQTSTAPQQRESYKTDLFEEFSFTEAHFIQIDELIIAANKEDLQKRNETTPPKQMSQESAKNSQTPVKISINRRTSGTGCKNGVSKTIVKKRLPFSDKPTKVSYALNNIYERLFGCQPNNGHQAESDCITLLHCVVVKSKEFCKWSDENCKVFNQIAAMEVGKKL